MAVKRRTPKRRAETSEQEECWRRDEPCGFIRFIEKERLDKLWCDHRERIIAEHIAEFPGTRPPQWWQRDAPEALDTDETEAAYLARHGLLSAEERRAMKASRFSDAQKAFILKQGADGIPVADICRKAGISQATYFNWKKKYDGLLPDEMRRLKQLEDENSKLKKLVADLSLDREMLQDIIRRKL